MEQLNTIKELINQGNVEQAILQLDEILQTDSPAKDEPHEEEEQEEVVTNLYFGSDYLDAMENEQMFLLFVNRQNIYIFSKKCLSEEEQNKLREIFTEKSIL